MQINIGAEPHVAPTIKGCLEENLGKFHTTQNAILIHEWLRSTEVTPPVLTPKIIFGNDRTEERQVGYTNSVLYPERYYPGQLLKLEQTMLAVPAISDTINRSIARMSANTPGSDSKDLGATVGRLMDKLHVVEAFSASALYFGHSIPARVMIETMTVLDVLVTMVMTQRDQVIYEDKADGSKVPINLFNPLELDKVIGRIHQGSAENFFPNPALQATADNLRDKDFFCQCAMAFSAASTVMIPRSYIQPDQTDVYVWAYRVLTEMKDRVPDFRVKPKLSVVSPI